LFLPPAEWHFIPFRNDFSSALRPNVLAAYTPEQYGDAIRADQRRIVRAGIAADRSPQPMERA